MVCCLVVWGLLGSESASSQADVLAMKVRPRCGKRDPARGLEQVLANAVYPERQLEPIRYAELFEYA